MQISINCGVCLNFCIEAPYSAVFVKASFIVRGCFIFRFLFEVYAILHRSIIYTERVYNNLLLKRFVNKKIPCVKGDKTLATAMSKNEGEQPEKELSEQYF